MSDMNNEPTLQDMDDYRGEESQEKRKTIWYVIAIGLLIGVVYTGAKFYFAGDEPLNKNDIVVRNY
jgi:hypothetical protein